MGWDLNKTAVRLHMGYSNAFSWKKYFIFHQNIIEDCPWVFNWQQTITHLMSQWRICASTGYIQYVKRPGTCVLSCTAHCSKQHYFNAPFYQIIFHFPCFHCYHSVLFLMLTRFPLLGLFVYIYNYVEINMIWSTILPYHTLFYYNSIVIWRYLVFHVDYRVS